MPESLDFVPTLTLATPSRGCLPYIFPELLPLPRLPVAPLCNYLTRPLCSGPITVPSSLIRVDPSQCRTLVLWAWWLFPTWPSSLTLQRLVPAVPHKSLGQLHASYTPVAIRPIIRFLADLSQR